MLRPWISNIQLDEQLKGSRYQDSATEENRQLNFSQVLLRSNAIEELLACIVCNPMLRVELLLPWGKLKDDSADSTPNSDRTHTGSDMSETQLAVMTLYQFLTKMLVGDMSVWFGVVTILLSQHGHDSTEIPENAFEEDIKIRERSDSAADWVARCERRGFRTTEIGLIRVLKRDWYDEWLEMERRDLAATVDLKKAEMIQKNPSQISSEPSQALWNRIKLSSELVDLHEFVKDNLDSSAMHRSETRKNVLTRLDESRTQVEAAKQAAKTEQEKCAERKLIIQENSRITEKDYEPRMKAIFEERIVVDSKIASLEERRSQLKIELENVITQLADAQAVQRGCMGAEQKLRTDINARRDKFETMMLEESSEERENKLDVEICQSTTVAIDSIMEKIDSIYTADANQLNDVYTQFDNAFVEAVQDHTTVLCESIQDIYRRTKRLADEMESVKRAKNSTSMSEMLHSGLNEPEKQEFSASVERLNVKLGEVESKLRLEREELDRFEQTFNGFYKRFENKLMANRLLKGEVDKVDVVFAETLKILNKYNIDRRNLPEPTAEEPLSN